MYYSLSSRGKKSFIIKVYKEIKCTIHYKRDRKNGRNDASTGTVEERMGWDTWRNINRLQMNPSLPSRHTVNQ